MSLLTWMTRERQIYAFAIAITGCSESLASTDALPDAGLDVALPDAAGADGSRTDVWFDVQLRDGRSDEEADTGRSDSGRGDAQSDSGRHDARLDTTATTDGALDASFVGECAINNGGCDINASCRPEVFGVTCRCNFDFAGDGRTCFAYSQTWPGLQVLGANSTALDTDALALSGDGTTIAVAYTDRNYEGHVAIGETTGALIRIAGDTREFGAIALSADGHTLLRRTRSAVIVMEDSGGWHDVGQHAAATSNANVFSASADARRMVLRRDRILDVCEAAADWSWTCAQLLGPRDINRDGLLGNRGVSMSSDGNVVAAISWSGTLGSFAHVFRRNGDDWSMESLRLSENIYMPDSVALSGNGTTVAVGEALSGSPRGDVRIYAHAANWTLEHTLTAPASTGNNEFGFAVAIANDGNTLVVGSPNRVSQAGGTYVFARANGEWSDAEFLRQRTPAATGSSTAYCVAIAPSSGSVVATSGIWGTSAGTVIVGAPVAVYFRR